MLTTRLVPSELEQLKAEKQAQSTHPAPRPPFETTTRFESQLRAAQYLFEDELKTLCGALGSHLAVRKYEWWRSIERNVDSENDRKFYEEGVNTWLAATRELFSEVIHQLMDRAREAGAPDSGAVAKWAGLWLRWNVDCACHPAILAQLLDDAGLVVLDQVPEWIEPDSSVTAVATRLRSRIDEQLRAVVANAELDSPLGPLTQPGTPDTVVPSVAVPLARDYKSTFKRAIWRALLYLGDDASTQEVANWITEQLPETPMPKYCHEADLGLVVRHDAHARDQFHKDVQKIRMDIRGARRAVTLH